MWETGFQNFQYEISNLENFFKLKFFPLTRISDYGNSCYNVIVYSGMTSNYITDANILKTNGTSIIL